MGRTVRVALLLVPGLLLAGLSVRSSEARDGEVTADLAALRANYADHYFELRPRMELAYRLSREGRSFSALVMCETTRRIFGYEESDKAWVAVFLGIELEQDPDREQVLLDRLEAAPGDIEALQGLIEFHKVKDDRAPALAYLKKLILADPANLTEHLYSYARLRNWWLFRDLDEILEPFAEQHPEAPESAVAAARAVLSSEPERARRILLAAAERHPDCALVHHQLAEAARKRGDLDEAELRLLRAATLRPDCEEYQGAAAEFFLELREDDARALPFMLATHFLNPYHFSDHRDSTVARIAKIGLKLARARAPEGTSIEEMIRSGDTLQATLAFRAMSSEWKSEYVELAVELLAHDLEDLSSGAARLLADNVDGSFEPQLARLLESRDVRVRARALYVDVALHGEGAYPRVKEAFRSESQLVRYEALGALFHAGGEAGRAIVEEHRSREKNEKMLMAIEADLEHWKEGD